MTGVVTWQVLIDDQKGDRIEQVSLVIQNGGLFIVKGAMSDKSEEISQFRFEPVDINNASYEKLMTVRGVGEKRAAEIVTQRSITPFKSSSDLKRLPGVSEKLAEKLAKQFYFSKK